MPEHLTSVLLLFKFVLRKAQFNAKVKERKAENTNHHSLTGQL
jgi:hypothetical protein